jgi:gamma-glutamyltranspeptidase/glutathione hydrolase
LKDGPKYTSDSDKRFGKVPWKDLFTDAIGYAERGFPVTEVIQEAWAGAENVGRLRANTA